MIEEKFALGLEGVSKTLEGKQVLKDIDWSVKRNEHWAILGPNGAGKTTLAEIIAGYIWPTEGEVTVLGNRFGNVDLRDLRKDIGFLNSALLNEIPSEDTVLEVVLSGKFGSLGLYNSPTEKDVSHAENLLEIVGCSDLSDREFGKLSQGERQKVLIARALMPKPGLMILDEPAIGLDPAAREKFLQRICKVGKMEEGPTILYITHHIQEIIPLFKKVLVLREGEILSKGRREEVLTGDVLSDAFNLDFEVLKKNDKYLISKKN